MKVCEKVFRNYDIKGIYEKELTTELAYLIGKAFAKTVKKTVIIGHDARKSSNALNTNLIKGLTSSGVEVIDLGLVSMPIFYYARILLNNPYAIMITTDDLDNSYNGFKLFDEQGQMYGQKINNILSIILNDDFIDGVGVVKPYDINLEYKNMLLKKIVLGPKKLKTVVSYINGTINEFYSKIIKEWGADVISLPNIEKIKNSKQNTNDTFSKTTEQLTSEVIKNNADLGILFDIDGNKISITDEKGNYIKSDMFMLIIWKSLYKVCKSKNVLFDIRCSNALRESLEKLNLKPKYNKTGSIYLKNIAKEKGYDFAGDYEGHFCFYDEFYGDDDSLYVVGRLLKILSYSDFKVSDYLKNVPKYYSSDEEFIKIREDKKDLIISKIKNYAKTKGYNYIDVDGVRIEYKDGFALVRKSINKNSIVVMFEGKTKEIMETYRLQIMKLINEEL